MCYGNTCEPQIPVSLKYGVDQRRAELLRPLCVALWHSPKIPLGQLLNTVLGSSPLVEITDYDLAFNLRSYVSGSKLSQHEGRKPTDLELLMFVLKRAWLPEKEQLGQLIGRLLQQEGKTLMSVSDDDICRLAEVSFMRERGNPLRELHEAYLAPSRLVLP